MRILISIALSVLLLSCGQSSNNQKNNTPNTPNNQTKEAFTDIDATELNKRLSQENRTLTAQEVMRLYYPQESSGEGKEAIVTTQTILDNEVIEVTLIHANLPDDSTRDIKFVMELKETNEKWTVLSLKKNWKCWEGRGHTDWGIDLCT